ncbi:MAG: alkaline phosphatase family protein [Nitrososphaerota archaeon]|jgi:phospholipase C|nr:alkaline phosphatase family protein [Nitrososphaerota archaeon]
MKNKLLKWGSIAIILLITMSGSISFAAAQPNSQTPIKHVIYIMKENQSFDDYFGVYPYGPYGMLKNNSIVGELSVPYGIQNDTSSIKVPNYPGLGWLLGYSHLRYLNSSSQVDPGEGWVDYHGDWDWGRNNGFASYSGPASLVYVSNQQIPYYWDYAEEYVLADNYYTPVLTETLPNRLASLAGYSPVSNDFGPPPYVNLNQTIFYQLNQNNVSWGYFELFSSTQNPPSSEIYPLNSIQGFNNLAYMNNVENLSVFLAEAKNGTLPAVSFVMPFGLAGEGNVPDISEHPSANITAGQDWTVNIINSVMQGPDWNSSTIFITWDEWGGFFDNVPPPQVNAFGYGGRVPLLIISPYAKENYIDSNVLNHDSILKFIDYNLNIPYLSSWVAQSGSVLSAFDFNQNPRPPVVLGPTPNIVGTIGNSAGYIQFENGSRLTLTAKLTTEQYPIPLQIPLTSLNYSSPPFKMPVSSYSFSVPPAWLSTVQFFLILFSLVALIVAIIITRFAGSFALKQLFLIATIILGLVTSVLGMIWTAIPATPVPPTEPTYSFITDLGFIMIALGAIILIFPYIKRFLPKGEQTIPDNVRFMAKAIIAAGAIAVIASIIATPGMVFPVSTLTPNPLNPPQTVLQMVLATISPLTGLGVIITISSFSIFVVQRLYKNKKKIINLN